MRESNLNGNPKPARRRSTKVFVLVYFEGFLSMVSIDGRKIEPIWPAFDCDAIELSEDIGYISPFC